MPVTRPGPGWPVPILFSLLALLALLASAACHRSGAPDKRATLQRLLREYSSVYVHLDPRRPGVRLPASLLAKGGPDVVLEYGRDLPKPIPDLTVADDGIWATLSFGGVNAPTFVPWASVYVMEGVRREPVVWSADAPPDAPMSN